MDMQKKDSMKMNVPQAMYMTASACDAVGKTAVYNQGFFVMEHAGMPFWKLFLTREKDSSWNGFQNLLFPGISITNTSPSLTEF
jgi:hypothetical protein